MDIMSLLCDDGMRIMREWRGRNLLNLEVYPLSRRIACPLYHLVSVGSPLCVLCLFRWVAVDAVFWDGADSLVPPEDDEE